MSLGLPEDALLRAWATHKQPGGQILWLGRSSRGALTLSSLSEETAATRHGAERMKWKKELDSLHRENTGTEHQA